MKVENTIPLVAMNVMIGGSVVYIVIIIQWEKEMMRLIHEVEKVIYAKGKQIT